MRKIWLFIISLFALSCATDNKDTYVISGTVDQDISGYIYLQKRVDEVLTTIDSTLLSDRTFRFTGGIGFPDVYIINIPETKSIISFFVEASEITMEINTQNLDMSEISGSASQDLYERYLNLLEKYDTEIREAYRMYRTAEEFNNISRMNFYDSVIDASFENKKNFVKDYIIKNGEKIISPYIAYRNTYQFDLSELEEIIDSFDESIQPSAYIPYLEDHVEILRRVSIGQKYIPFSMRDTSEAIVPVSTFIGEKYVLFDFWASWCGPCRVENPNLVATYNRFRDEGFEIVGISFDTNKDNWLRAIDDDGLTWPQLSDLKGWDNSAGRLYGIRSIPANVLVDKDGYIIDKNLRGEDLNIKLEQIFLSNI
jgi:peroxiredoxin